MSPGSLKSTEICLEAIDLQGKGRLMRGLLDTGCSKSLVVKEFTNYTFKCPSQEYTAYGNHKILVNRAANMKFKLIEFSDSKIVTFKCMVDSTSDRQQPYDIILGLDFLFAMGIDLCFSRRTITWGDTVKEMQPLVGQLLDPEMSEVIYFMHTQSPLLKEMED